MKQRICPVCGHLESAGTEYCTECNSKTIEYDDGTSEPEEEDAWEESAGRQEAGRKGSGKSGGGSRRVPLGGIGIVAVLVIVALVFVNRNLSDSGEDSGSSGGSGPAQSGSEDEDLSGGAEDGSLPGNGEEPGNGKEPADGQEERYPEESGEGQDGQESDTELSAEGILRAGPEGPRPALRHRPGQDPPPAGLASGDEIRRWDQADHPLVSGQPPVVGEPD